MTTEPTHPGSLATPAELCAFWRSLDAHFGTGTDSPLHHDHRCEQCVRVISYAGFLERAAALGHVVPSPVRPPLSAH